MQILIWRSNSDIALNADRFAICVHEQVAKRIANVRFTDYVFYAFGAVGYKRRNVGGKRPQICRKAIAFADMIT